MASCKGPRARVRAVPGHLSRLDAYLRDQLESSGAVFVEDAGEAFPGFSRDALRRAMIRVGEAAGAQRYNARRVRGVGRPVGAYARDEAAAVAGARRHGFASCRRPGGPELIGD